ncbi:MAG: MtrR family transcriptional [Desulfobulbaceae bacterium]|nr:MAG: MtrR family transcriptional [Desulfobulbaceae bacterium]
MQMVKKSKKSEIIDTATILFATKGFTDTSMTEVASLTGVVGATIFYHFKTKEELFISVLENLKTGLVEAFTLFFQEEHFPLGLDMLLGAVSYHLHLSEEKKEWFLLLRHHYTHELAVANPVCRRYLVDIYSCLVEIFEKPLTIGQQDGSIRTLSTNKTALIIFAMVDGVIQLDDNNLYNAGTLYRELLISCKNMVQASNE